MSLRGDGIPPLSNIERSGSSLAAQLQASKKKAPTLVGAFFWRRHPDLNRGSRICSPMPYHLAMAPSSERCLLLFPNSRALPSVDGFAPRPLPPPKIKTARFDFVQSLGCPFVYKFLLLSEQKNWSGRRGSNSLPPPWQGGALPDELRPHIKRCRIALSSPSRNAR